MNSDPDMLEAFRRQCRSIGPELALLAWTLEAQPDVDRDDLIDIYKEETGSK